MSLIWIYIIVGIVIIDYVYIGIANKYIWRHNKLENIKENIVFSETVRSIMSNCFCLSKKSKKVRYISKFIAKFVVTENYIIIGKTMLTFQYSLPLKNITKIEQKKDWFIFTKIRIHFMFDDKEECLLDVVTSGIEQTARIVDIMNGKR